MKHAYNFLLENLEGRGYLGDIGKHAKIILK
jgi:hypothetical protein